MIAFDLVCENGHRFEGWFADAAAYQDQLDQGLLSCPVCENTEIRKALSPVAIRQGKRLAEPAVGNKPVQEEPFVEKLMEVSVQLEKFIDANFVNVGTDFAKEALKIHYGVTEPRNIRGVSSEAEDKMLADEGVAVVKVPLLKRKKSDCED